jgi:ABC-type bacteriocin/lantibiotic exporter with double-glycine peptidase domain
MRVIFLILILVMSVLVCRADGAPEQTGGFACGLSATYIFLNRAGHHVEYDELVREFLEQKTPDSLLAIKAVLARHGCATVGIKADAGYFLDQRGPAIVYLQLSGYTRRSENHFAYLVGASRQSGVELLDPIFDLNEASYLTWDSFTRSYQGYALIPHA